MSHHSFAPLFLQIGRLLTDWRRLNVAFTRAKHKMVLVGSMDTLQDHPVFQDLCSLLRQRGWVSIHRVLLLALCLFWLAMLTLAAHPHPPCYPPHQVHPLQAQELGALMSE